MFRFSEKSKFDNKTAIRGGIPIVFRQLSFVEPTIFCILYFLHICRLFNVDHCNLSQSNLCTVGVIGLVVFTCWLELSLSL